MENLRFYDLRKDLFIPSKKDGISLMDYVEENNGGEVKIAGIIGRDGVKTHIFNAMYITFNNEKIVCSSYSVCGAETYKSGTRLLPLGTEITCKKCQKHHL